jgi:hypothetical protein
MVSEFVTVRSRVKTGSTPLPRALSHQKVSVPETALSFLGCWTTGDAAAEKIVGL